MDQAMVKIKAMDQAIKEQEKSSSSSIAKAIAKVITIDAIGSKSTIIITTTIAITITTAAKVIHNSLDNCYSTQSCSYYTTDLNNSTIVSMNEYSAVISY